MAKGNLLLGQGRNSLGDVVMYRRNGLQISRVRVRSIKNPRTEAQLIPRIIVNTVAQAYSRMKEVTDHSFQGLSKGAANMARFQKVNNRMLRQQLSAAGEDWTLQEGFVPVGYRALAPNPYIVSEGSYTAIPNSAVSIGQGGDHMQLALSANTYAALISQYGLQRGDQLTFVVISGTVADIVVPGLFPNLADVALSYSRVILDPIKADGTAEELSAAFIGENGKIGSANPANDGNQAFVFEFDAAAGVKISQSDREVLAYGVIVSHKQADGTYSYSNCQLQVNPVTLYDNMASALTASQSTSIDTTSPYYLNQAKN